MAIAKKKTVKKSATKKTLRKVKTKKEVSEIEEYKCKHPDFMYMGIPLEARQMFDSTVEVLNNRCDVVLDYATIATYSKVVIHITKLHEKFGFSEMSYKTPQGTYAARPERDELSMYYKQLKDCVTKLGLSEADRKKIQKSMTAAHRPLKGFRGKLEQ